MSNPALDSSHLIGAITQLQILHRQGRLAVPLRVRWLPSAVHSASTVADISDVFGHLKPLLRINLGRISRGAELPSDALEHLHGFYRSLVLLRLSPERARAEQAEEMLVAVSEELVVSGADGAPASAARFAELWEQASWLRMYRALAPQSPEETSQTREIAEYLVRCDLDAPPRDANALALVTWLAAEGRDPADRDLLLRWVRCGLDHPGRWQWLRGDPVRDRLWACEDHQLRWRFVTLAIGFLLTGEREAARRSGLLQQWFLEEGELDALVKLLAGWRRLERESGVLHERVLDALETRGPGSAAAVARCLLPPSPADAEGRSGPQCGSEQAASADAQFLIGDLLCAHDIAGQEVFQRFCRRVARLELTVGLRAELTERVLHSTSLKQGLIRGDWPADKLVASVRKATDQRRRLFHLLLLALREFEGEMLGEITRSLSLIDVAIRQTKIDERHLAALMADLQRDPREGLLTLVDEERMDRKASQSPELGLLYLNLRVIAQTSDRIEAVDLDDLSRTLRKLKILDARGRQC